VWAVTPVESEKALAGMPAVDELFPPEDVVVGVDVVEVQAASSTATLTSTVVLRPGCWRHLLLRDHIRRGC
jgi:hypothetical protein